MSRQPIVFPRPCAVSWESMPEHGRARLCGKCKNKVYDLAKHTDEEILDLMRNSAHVCGYAEIKPGGEIITRSRAAGMMLMAAIAMPVAFLPLSSEGGVQSANTGSIRGSIAETLVGPNGTGGGAKQAVRVIASSAGVRDTTLSDTSGAYRFDNLPSGSYRLEFHAADSYEWSEEDVLVCSRHLTVQDTRDPRMPRPNGTGTRIAGTMVRPVRGGAELFIRLTTQDGQRVLGATLTAQRLEDHQKIAGSMGSDEAYHFGILPPGDYSLEISGHGFETRIVPKVSLRNGEHHFLGLMVCAPST
jgi:Carboxypeptidase regulatory-like domain